MAEGTRCTCGAGHETYGACLRAKGIQYGSLGDNTNSVWDKTLAHYADARRQGLQPEGTSVRAVAQAKMKADRE